MNNDITLDIVHVRYTLKAMDDNVLNNVISNDVFIESVENKIKRIFDSLDVSENTRIEYAYFVKLFLSFIKERGFDNQSFLNYKRYLAERTDFAVSTKNKYLVTARILLKELSRVGSLSTDITHNIKTFNQSKKHKRVGVNKEEIDLIMDRVNTLPRSPKNTRLKAILGLLILQGFRQCEIVRLDVKDIDLVNKLIFIRGKGQDDKESVDLHPETIKALESYLKTNKIADGAVFPSWSNNGRGKRMTTNALRQIVKDTLGALEIHKTVHGFRHYFTTTLLKAYGGDLLSVARYTRHKSLEMLQVYDDSIKQKADLPRYYSAFETINFKNES